METAYFKSFKSLVLRAEDKEKTLTNARFLKEMEEFDFRQEKNLFFHS